MKIKTRQNAAGQRRSITCRSINHKPATRKRSRRRNRVIVPRRVPEGVAELALEAAAFLRKPAGDSWTVSASAVAARLRAKYGIVVSIPWILKRLAAAGYVTDKGGRPRSEHDTRLETIRRFHADGMSLAAIGGELGGLSRQRISVLLKEATGDEEKKK